MHKNSSGTLALLPLSLTVSGCLAGLTPGSFMAVPERSGSATVKLRPEVKRVIDLGGAAAGLADGSVMTWNGLSVTVRNGRIEVPESFLQTDRIKIGFPGLGDVWVTPSQLAENSLYVNPNDVLKTEAVDEKVSSSLRQPPARNADRPRVDLPPLRQPGGSTLKPGEGIQWLLDNSKNDYQSTFVENTDHGRGLSPQELITLYEGSTVDNNAGKVTITSPNANPAVLDDGHQSAEQAQNGVQAGQARSSLITNNSGAIISTNGGHFANLSQAIYNSEPAPVNAEQAGSLISHAGGSITSNNGASLINSNAATVVGFPYFPLALPPAKLQLLQFAMPMADPVRVSPNGVREYLWPESTRVRAITSSGAPLTPWRTTRSNGSFVLDLPRRVPVVFFIQAELRSFRPEDPIHRALGMAIAPLDRSRPTAVLIDANTTITTGSTLHLLSYIPSEHNRLDRASASFQDQVVSLMAELERVDKKDASRESQREAEREAKIASEINAVERNISLATGRMGELNRSWTGFNPLFYGNDYHRADRVLTQAVAETVSKAGSLRDAYDPLYRLRQAGELIPASFYAIPPDSPI